jgi:hypothetical protein
MIGHDRRRGSDALIAHRGAGRSSRPVPTNSKQVSPTTGAHGQLHCASLRRPETGARNLSSALWTMSFDDRQIHKDGLRGEHLRFRRRANPVGPDTRRFDDLRVSRRWHARLMPRENTSRQRRGRRTGRLLCSLLGTRQPHRGHQNQRRAMLRHGPRCCLDCLTPSHHDRLLLNRLGRLNYPGWQRQRHDRLPCRHDLNGLPARRAILRSIHCGAIHCPPCHSSRSIQ